ncbi:MAG: thiamine phosphate synthase [Sedimentisphaerales bacterium]|jgi:thiamine-phosphate pyrophosphorylase|nr:thiamine phosphate synthase [Sedimentisphaerales bacterium]
MTDRATFRIIDANFNRAREALRLVEDHCRFTLDHQGLTSTAKAMRHQLASLIAKLPAEVLLACRDTDADVGMGLDVQGQMVRTDLQDCLKAAFNRLTEALRVLAEACSTVDKQIAGQIEQLRYQVYAVERQVAMHSMAALRFSQVRLYVIINSTLPAEIMSLAVKCISGGADCLQLRCKGIPDRDFFAIAEQFVKICKDLGVLSIINDRMDIAVASGADGVHLGSMDLPLERIRHMQHRPMVLGLTTHDLHQLQAAIEQGPTYVSIGPVFPTTTKPDLVPAGLRYLKRAIDKLANTGIYHVAIGGIDPGNIKSVLETGARAVAVCSAVDRSPDPISACRKLKQLLTA